MTGVSVEVDDSLGFAGFKRDQLCPAFVTAFAQSTTSNDLSHGSPAHECNGDLFFRPKLFVHNQSNSTFGNVFHQNSHLAIGTFKHGRGPVDAKVCLASASKAAVLACLEVGSVGETTFGKEVRQARRELDF